MYDIVDTCGCVSTQVYLTADSPHEISTIEPGVVYILGGIVDRNRYPNITHDKATVRMNINSKQPTPQSVASNLSTDLWIELLWKSGCATLTFSFCFDSS